MAALTASLLLSFGVARAHSFEESIKPAHLSSEDEFVITVEEGEAPKATGPGFRYLGRLTLGGYSINEVGEYTYVPLEYREPGVFWIDPTALGKNSADSVMPREDGGVIYVTFYFKDLSLQEIRHLTSIELMGQHLWDGQGDLLNDRPQLRVTVNGSSFGVDAGKLPVVEVSPTISKEDQKKREPWYAGFQHKNYFAYGVRLNSGYDGYRIDGVTNVMGGVYSHTEIDHYVIGPQITIGRVASKKRWQFDLSGSLMIGYGRAEVDQFNGFGTDLTPGGVNKLFFLQPSYSHHETEQEDFAAHAEVRLVSSYLIKPNWSVDLIARAFVAGPWYRSSQIVEYDAPEFGIGPAESDSIDGANLAVAVTYLR